MSAWLDPLRRALDDAPAPVRFFFRDDDAGWGDAHLHRLLDLFARHGVAIDVAVIPEALGADLARHLRARASAGVGLHTHGFGHVNHEPAGRKCEFGSARPEADQRRDLEAGKRRLEEALGPVLDPIFTPPWNRCTQVTVDCLARLGYRVLSRNERAAPLEMRGLGELPVSVDWLWRGKPASRRDLGRRIAGVAGNAAPVGIMLHHAVMADNDIDALAELLALLAHHDKAHCRPMRELAAATGAPTGACEDCD